MQQAGTLFGGRERLTESALLCAWRRLRGWAEAPARRQWRGGTCALGGSDWASSGSSGSSGWR